MREIKFRVWGLLTKKFWYFNIGQQIQETNEDIYLQYTGLKDKNGREIYDGDIVKVLTYEDWFDDIGGGVIQEVKWSDFMAGWRGFTAKMDVKYHAGNIIAPDEQVEIVGNIFENKELLCEK